MSVRYRNQGFTLIELMIVIAIIAILLLQALLAKVLGLPYKRMIAATNANNTKPRSLSSGQWNPNPTVSTIINAMDVSNPNNFPRVVDLEKRHGLPLRDLLSSVSLDDEQTRAAMRKLWQQGCITEPHTALAWGALQGDLQPEELGFFLCTAHPAKFPESLVKVLGRDVELQPELARVRDFEVLSSAICGNFTDLRAMLLRPTA